MRKPSHGRWRP